MQQQMQPQNPQPNTQLSGPGQQTPVNFSQGQNMSQGYGQQGQFTGQSQYQQGQQGQFQQFPPNSQAPPQTGQPFGSPNGFQQGQQQGQTAPPGQSQGSQQIPTTPQKPQQPLPTGQGFSPSNPNVPPPVIINQSTQQGQYIQGAPYQSVGQSQLPPGQYQSNVGGMGQQQMGAGQGMGQPQPNQSQGFPPNTTGNMQVSGEQYGGQNVGQQPPGQSPPQSPTKPPTQQGMNQGSPTNIPPPMLPQQPPNSQVPPIIQPPPAPQSPTRPAQPAQPLSPSKQLDPASIIKNPESYLSSNIYEQTIDGVKYNYFLADKENNTATKNNTRFFVVDSRELAYSTKQKLKDGSVPFVTLGKMPQIKARYKLENITMENPSKGSMKMKIKKNDKETLNWLLVAKNKDVMMMNQIFTLFNDAKNKRLTQLNSESTIKEPVVEQIFQSALGGVEPSKGTTGNLENGMVVNPVPVVSPQAMQPGQPQPGQGLNGQGFQQQPNGRQQFPQGGQGFQGQPGQSGQPGQGAQGFQSQGPQGSQGFQGPQGFQQPLQPGQSGQMQQSNQFQGLPGQFGPGPQGQGFSPQGGQGSFDMQPGMQPQQPGMQYSTPTSGMQQPPSHIPGPQSNQQSLLSNLPPDSTIRRPQDQQLSRIKEEFSRLQQQNRRAQQKGSELPLRLNRPVQPVNEDFRKMYTRQVQERKKLLYTDNQNWNYQFLKGDDEHIVLNFKKFSEALVADIIDDMSERQRTYNPSQPYSEATQTILYSDYHGVDVRLCFTDIKDFKLIKENKESVYDQAAIKAAMREFKNMDYILQLTRNKGKIRVPLASLVQYKGIVALVKAQIPRDDYKSPKSLLKQLQLLSRQSHIKQNIFEQQKALNIVPLQSKFYDKLARQQNSPLLRQTGVFDIYYLDNVRNFIPVDLQFAPKDPENYLVRPEFLQRQEFADKMFIGESMENYLQKQKVSRQVQESIRDLSDSTKQIIKLVQQLIVQWQDLNETIVSSDDVTQMLHTRGIPIRYLGLVYSNAKLPLIRKVCMSEIAARVAKTVLRFDLQQYLKNTILSKAESKSRDRLTEVVVASDEMLVYAIEFLNAVVGNTEYSTETWNRMNKQALYSFNISLSKQDIAEGHLIQALLYHCKVKCGFKYQNRDRLFTRRVFERTKDSYFVVSSKNYSLGYTDMYRRIKSIIAQQQIQNLQQLKSLLNLRKVDLPQHLRLDNTYLKIAAFLSAFLPPKSLTPGDNLPCTSVYRLIENEIPSQTTINIALTDIKWDLKTDNLQQALKKQDWLEKKIVRWCGELHPLLDDLHLTFSRYYLMKGKYEEAINYAKSALANLSNLLGNNSLKTAEIHYELANIYLKSSRRQQALNSFKKAKNIFDNKNQTEDLPYAQIELKIAALDLQFDKLEEAAAFTLHAIHIIQEQVDHENDLVEAYELITRIYEAGGKIDEVSKIAEYCGSLLGEIKDQSNLQRMLKISVYPLLSQLPPRPAEKLSNLLDSLPYQYQTANYNNGLSFLKKLIESNTLMSKFSDYVNDLQQVINAINSNGLVARWRGLDTEIKTKGQEFIAIMESLVYVLGDGFVSGALTNA